MEEFKKISGFNNFDEHFGLPDELRKNSFRVPEGYFENLSGNISDKINVQPQVSFSLLPKLAMIAVALAAVLIVGSVYFLKSSKTEKVEVAITYDEILKSGIADEMDEQLLLEHYFALPSAESAESELQNSVDNYLIHNNIDISLIINEL